MIGDMRGSDFLSDLAAIGLAEAAGYPGLDPAATAARLADVLVRAGVLTRFQADEVLAGRAERLAVGRLLLLDRVGGGGMGVVYKALHRALKRVVAIKMLWPHRADTPGAELRFRREVEALGKLHHPNIVTPHDAGAAHGFCYLVMEYVDGADLQATVERSGPLDPREAVECALQAAQGLAYAHEQGVIHRDVKPANLVRQAADGIVKVADLGLAKIANQSTDYHTTSGMAVGTPQFMAPEQRGDEEVGPPADVFGLGGTLYFLLTGRVRTATRRAGEIYPPTVPAELATLVQRMLAQNPADRPSMRTIAEELAQQRHSRAGVVRYPPTREYVPARRPDRRWVWVAAVAAAVSLAVVVAIALRPPPGVRNDPDPGPITRSSPATGPGTPPGPRLEPVKDPSAKKPPDTPVQPVRWNDELKTAIEEYFEKGVAKNPGQFLYGEVDTALATGVSGEWRIGPGLTRDGSPVVFRVAGDRLFVFRPSEAQLRVWNLAPRSFDRTYGRGFRIRPLEGIRLTKDGAVRVGRGPGGRRTFTVRFTAQAVSEMQIESVTLILETSQPGQKGEEVTAELYQKLDWTRPMSGSHEVKLGGHSGDQFPTSGAVRVRIEAFVTAPNPGRYRISNVLLTELVPE